MREIKFRAWNNELKTMADNNNLQGTLGSMILATRSDGKEFTFMQHTGLKDSEGLEIYEGDIIKYRDFNDKNHYLLVQWSKENASFLIGWVRIRSEERRVGKDGEDRCG